mgnify:CR=1 FL=1
MSNRERNIENAKKYREENKERLKQTRKLYWQNNSDLLLNKHKEYRKNQPAGIYKIECIPTGKAYIGQSTMVPDRWRVHTSQLRIGKHHKSRLQADYDKYGPNAFEYSVIQEYPCDTSREILFEHEQRLIDEYLAEGKELYNISRYN